jgi:perosamine synthetase
MTIEPSPSPSIVPLPVDRIPVAGPWITELEIRYVTDAAHTGWYATANDWAIRFEKLYAEVTGRRFAVALPSCTAGLHLSLAALGIGPGDEVICPESTWIATSAPISYVGATLVPVDVEPDSWCASAAAIEQAITPRTKAIIVVDLYGNMPDMDAILGIADRHGIPVIEDAAEAAGAVYRGRPAGSFGTTSVFSFHGSKTLTTGEGGMLLTDDEALYRRILVLRDHGRGPQDFSFFNQEVGFKYKMSALQAAMGVAQLERLPELIERKRAIFGWYRDRLSHLNGLTLNSEAPGVTNVYWMVTAVFDAALGVKGVDVQAALAKHNIDTRPFFHPLSALPAYADLPGRADAARRNKVAYDIAPRGLNLPSALTMTEPLVDRVCKALEQSLAGGI